VIDKYNQILWEQLQKTRLATWAQNLQNEAKNRLLQAQQLEYKVINKAAAESKRHVEKTCRKIKASTMPWCPQVSWANKSHSILEGPPEPA